jgi:hypothetical protein
MFENEEGTEGDVVETPVDAGAGAEGAAPEWDGDFEKLDKQPWWASVPEAARPHILKAHEERTSATARAGYLDRIFGADDAVTALRGEIADKEKVISGLKESLGKAEGTAKEHETRARGLEERIADQETEQSFKTMQAKYPDIFADVVLTEDKKGVDPTKGAYPRFVRLLSSGMSEEDAATAARAFIAKPAEAAPARPATRTVEVPKSVSAATPGGNTPRATVSGKEANETFDDRAARMMREAEADARRKG